MTTAPSQSHTQSPQSLWQAVGRRRQGTLRIWVRDGLPVVLIAHLVEHCIGITKSWVQIPFVLGRIQQLKLLSELNLLSTVHVYDIWYIVTFTTSFVLHCLSPVKCVDGYFQTLSERSQYNMSVIQGKDVATSCCKTRGTKSCPGDNLYPLSNENNSLA